MIVYTAIKTPQKLTRSSLMSDTFAMQIKTR